MPTERQRRWRPSWRPPRRIEALIVLIVALAVMAFVARDLAARHETTAARTTAKVIAMGYQGSGTVADDDAQDGDLADDEAAAGAMYAESHDLTGPSACPAYSAAFRRGCGDYARSNAPR